MTSARTRMSDETLSGYKAISSTLSKCENKPECIPTTPALCLYNARTKREQRVNAQEKANETALMNWRGVKRQQDIKMANVELEKGITDCASGHW